MSQQHDKPATKYQPRPPHAFHSYWQNPIIGELAGELNALECSWMQIVAPTPSINNPEARRRAADAMVRHLEAALAHAKDFAAPLTPEAFVPGWHHVNAAERTGPTPADPPNGEQP